MQVLQLDLSTVRAGLTLASSGNHALACAHACAQLSSLRSAPGPHAAASLDLHLLMATELSLHIPTVQQ